jgi:PPM family protein phosphatase
MRKSTMPGIPDHQLSSSASEQSRTLAMDSGSPLHAMLSNRGKVRHGNEDACGARAEIAAFVVCDGMGGAAAGEIASQLAVDTFLKYLQATRPPANGRATERHSPRSRLDQAVATANHAVYQQSRQTKGQRGMGTTLVALLYEQTPHPHADTEPGTEPTVLWLVHVGDSRCYRLRGGKLQQLTRDHSLVEEQIRAGILSRLQAETSPIRNIITRAVGSQPIVEPEIEAIVVHPGDVFLLASDGLTRELEDAELGKILRRELAGQPSEVALSDACHALVATANAHGGGDNITVLLLQFPNQ